MRVLLLTSCAGPHLSSKLPFSFCFYWTQNISRIDKFSSPKFLGPEKKTDIWLKINKDKTHTYHAKLRKANFVKIHIGQLNFHIISYIFPLFSIFVIFPIFPIISIFHVLSIFPIFLTFLRLTFNSYNTFISKISYFPFKPYFSRSGLYMPIQNHT